MYFFRKKILSIVCLLFCCCTQKQNIVAQGNQIFSFSITGISDLKFDIANQNLEAYLGYNPDYIKILEGEFVPIFQLSNGALLFIKGKNISKNDKIKLQKFTSPNLGYKIDMEIKAQNGNKQTYTLTLNIVGREMDTNYIPQSYYPTTKYIGVHRTPKATQAQLDRAYTDIKLVMDKMDKDLRKAVLKHGAKLLVAADENEITSDDYYIGQLPLEAIYTNDGEDETLPDPKTKISKARLEFIYLTVYYAFLIDPSLAQGYTDLKDAYKEADSKNLFIPGAAYQDGYHDPVHSNASQKNALKYGSFMYNLYRLYFAKAGSINIATSEYKLGYKKDIQTKNPKAYTFIQNYYDVN